MAVVVVKANVMSLMSGRHWISSNYHVIKWNGTLIKISYNSPQLHRTRYFVSDPMVLICYLNYGVITHPWFGSTSRSATSRVDVVNQQRDQQCEHKNITFVQFHYWILLLSRCRCCRLDARLHFTWLYLKRLEGNFSKRTATSLTSMIFDVLFRFPEARNMFYSVLIA